jgi:hypothetical protein
VNLVFQALVVTALALPGLIFRVAYNKGTWNYPVGRLGPPSDQIIQGLIHALWINGLWIGLVGLIRTIVHGPFRPIDFRAVASILLNQYGKDQQALEPTLAAIGSSPVSILVYVLGLYAFSGLLGLGLHVLVRRTRLDRRMAWPFRFENDWHYLLRGEILDFPPHRGSSRPLRKPKITSDDVLGTVVAAVVDLKDRSVLYLGFLVDFYFDHHGNLDRILLEEVRRRDLGSDASTAALPPPIFDLDQRYFVLRGHYFVLRMEEIKTLNVDYITRDDLYAFLHDLVKRRAEALWAASGKPEGGASHAWEQAEAEIIEELRTGRLAE